MLYTLFAIFFRNKKSSSPLSFDSWYNARSILQLCVDPRERVATSERPQKRPPRFGADLCPAADAAESLGPKERAKGDDERSPFFIQGTVDRSELDKATLNKGRAVTIQLEL